MAHGILMFLSAINSLYLCFLWSFLSENAFHLGHLGQTCGRRGHLPCQVSPGLEQTHTSGEDPYGRGQILCQPLRSVAQSGMLEVGLARLESGGSLTACPEDRAVASNLAS